MIRFSCPGCGATYTVGDEKGGKTGKCPKCQSQFQIPPAEGPPAAPPPSPADDAVEIAPCTGCGARLSVAATDLGSEVECPYCQAIYRAVKAGAPPAPPPRRARDDEDEEDERPSRRRRRDEEDEDDRPSRRRSRRDDEEDEDTRPARRRRDDDDEEDRPRKKKRRRRSRGDAEPHRGSTVLIFGILSLFCCPLIFGILAITYAQTDLAKMRDGDMDPDGESLTNIGRILGIVGIVLWVVSIFVRGALRAVN